MLHYLYSLFWLVVISFGCWRSIMLKRYICDCLRLQPRLLDTGRCKNAVQVAYQLHEIFSCMTCTWCILQSWLSSLTFCFAVAYQPPVVPMKDCRPWENLLFKLVRGLYFSSPLTGIVERLLLQLCFEQQHILPAPPSREQTLLNESAPVKADRICKDWVTIKDVRRLCQPAKVRGLSKL